jgi:parallel beta-helix repeat protein
MKKPLLIILLLFPSVFAYNLTVDYNTPLRTIPSTMWGTEIHDTWGMINLSPDLSSGNPSAIKTTGYAWNNITNYTWHREQLVIAKKNVLRTDLGMTRLIRVPNRGAEDWGGTTDTGTWTDSYFEEYVPWGWTVETWGTNNGRVFRSTNKRSGSYAVNISLAAGGNGGVSTWAGLGPLPNGVYNLTVLALGTGKLDLHIQEKNGYTDVCDSGEVTLTGSYAEASCVFTVNSYVRQGYRILVSLQSFPANMVWDDVNLTKDGVAIDVFDQDITRWANLAAWANQSGMTVVATVYTFPDSITNYTSDCAGDPPKLCAPRNFTDFGNIMQRIAQNITNGYRYSNVKLELMNEMDDTSFFAPTSTDQGRANIYLRMFNESYDALKATGPTPFCLGGIADIRTAAGKTFLQTVLNKTNKTDCVAFHTYQNTPDMFDDWLDQYVTVITTACGYGGNCSSIWLGEYNAADESTMKNDSLMRLQMSLANIKLLSLANYSGTVYQWSELTITNSTNYTQYPRIFAEVSEPLLNNTFYPIFNVSREFGWLYKQGMTVYQVNTTGQLNVTGTTAKGANGRFITVANKNNYAQSANVTVIGSPIMSVINAVTGASLNVAANKFNVSLGPMEVSHFNITFGSSTQITGCGVLSDDGVTYNLTSDIVGYADAYCINITAKNAVLDCQGHTVGGDEGGGGAFVGINIIYTVPTNTNVTIKNCTLTGWARGLRIDYANNNTVTYNRVSTSSQDGMLMDYSQKNQIVYNTFTANKYGISLEAGGAGLNLSGFNNASRNNLSSNTNSGLRLDESNDTIEGNIMDSNSNYGINLGGVGNIITNNTFRYNNGAIPKSGINIFTTAMENKIYNNFFNNTRDIYDQTPTGGRNYFNTSQQTGTRVFGAGTLIGGNYYANTSGTDYSETCTDANTDGICDNPYNITTMTTCSGATCGETDYLALSNKYSSGACIDANYAANLTAQTCLRPGCYWPTTSCLIALIATTTTQTCTRSGCA